MDGNSMNVKNAPHEDGGVNENEEQILGQEGEEEEKEPNTNEGGTPRPAVQQRRPIWKFYKQIPNEEHGVICSICGKTIKLTNSSTTMMIRHVRSCHPDVFQVLQKARILRELKKAISFDVRVEFFRQMGFSIRDASEAQAELEALENSISAAFQTISAAAAAGVDMLPSALMDEQMPEI